MEYQEFYLSKVGNDYDQYMLVGIKDGQGNTIATYNDLHYAELAVAFLNQMIDNNNCPNCKAADMQYPVDDGYPAFCVSCGYVEGELI